MTKKLSYHQYMYNLYSKFLRYASNFLKISSMKLVIFLVEALFLNFRI